MNQLNLNSTVGQWVAEHPQTSRVFEDVRLDYCCGGGKPLEQACRDRHLNPQEILARLHEAVETAESEPVQNWSQAGLTELCNHIEQTHHAYLRTELPRLTILLAKLVNAHGGTHRELPEVQQVFAALRSELEPHMFREEQELFPAIRRLEQPDTQPTFPFGTVSNPIRMMEHEHDIAGNALARIRELTCDYAVPTDACNTYRAALDGLRAMELDMHRHVHKENSILFPQAVERERALSTLHASR
jgi:regulator of cell morphogenesis and NO signaling